jgi:hypothetical protein
MHKPGDVVEYLDPNGEPHNALVIEQNRLHEQFVTLAVVDNGEVVKHVGLAHESHESKDGLHCWRDGNTYSEPKPQPSVAEAPEAEPDSETGIEVAEPLAGAKEPLVEEPLPELESAPEPEEEPLETKRSHKKH